MYFKEFFRKRGLLMLYLHDVWVNWFEGEENGYNVCYFHEWRKEDKIELLDQVPVLYITDELYDYIANRMEDLPKGLLKRVYKRSILRKGQMRQSLDYAATVTNGEDILTFDTAGYKIPLRKSRLIPRQEQMVHDMVKNTKRHSFQFEQPQKPKEYGMISLEPQLVIGLTRRERQLKQLLMMALDQLRVSSNIEELRYWLTEWNPKKYPSIKAMDSKSVWNSLYYGVRQGWSEAHESLGEKLVRGYPFLEKMWTFEQQQEQNKINQ